MRISKKNLFDIVIVKPQLMASSEIESRPYQGSLLLKDSARLNPSSAADTNSMLGSHVSEEQYFAFGKSPSGRVRGESVHDIKPDEMVEKCD